MIFKKKKNILQNIQDAEDKKAGHYNIPFSPSPSYTYKVKKTNLGPGSRIEPLRGDTA